MCEYVLTRTRRKGELCGRKIHTSSDKLCLAHVSLVKRKRREALQLIAQDDLLRYAKLCKKKLSEDERLEVIEEGCNAAPPNSDEEGEEGSDVEDDVIVNEILEQLISEASVVPNKDA